MQPVSPRHWNTFKIDYDYKDFDIKNSDKKQYQNLMKILEQFQPNKEQLNYFLTLLAISLNGDIDRK